MRSRHFLPIALLVYVIAAGFGCLDNGDPPIGHDTRPHLDSTPGIVSPPMLDRGEIPQTTCESEVGIIGTTQPGYNVYATGGAYSGIETANSSGRFCLPVKLNPDQLNVINVFVSNQSGQQSLAATVNVTHQTSSQCATPTYDGGVQPEPENVALKAESRSMEPPKTGNTNAVIDGNPSTTAHWDSDSWLPFTAYDGWVALKLEKSTSISKIVVRWRDNYGSATKEYGSEYMIMISSTPDAGDPEEGGVWTTLETVTSGDGGEDVFEYKDAQPSALHVALWMQFDGEGGNYDEQFVLGEFEVYDTPATNPQPPTTPGACSGAY